VKYHRGIMKYIVSVSKTFIHRGNHRHKQSTKKHWFIYYYDEEGKFRTEQVNFFQALFYKTQKYHRIRGVCQNCGRVWLYFIKSKREKMKCPNCDLLII
jgi:hypothetical protein